MQNEKRETIKFDKRGGNKICFQVEVAKILNVFFVSNFEGWIAFFFTKVSLTFQSNENVKKLSFLHFYYFLFDLHCHMVQSGRPARRPLQEVVEFGLKFPVFRVPSVGAVVERFAQKAHSGVHHSSVGLA